MTETAATAIALTFEQGYDRLQAISARVTSEDVPVAEMCDLFAEGKGLEKALTAYLDEQKSRVEAIERGDGVQSFRITAPSNGEAAKTPSTPQLQVAGPTALQSTSTPVRADDDIPF